MWAIACEGDAAMAQLVEHILGKDEVPSSNLGSSSKEGAVAFRQNRIKHYRGIVQKQCLCSAFCAKMPQPRCVIPDIYFIT